ncbi:MAG: TonB-dependent receptor [Bacteroidota bacterium]
MNEPRRHAVLLGLLLCLGGVAVAGTTGKITGTVRDAQTGEPIVGASIVIEGTRTGAATDVDGYYVILNVPPGRHTLAGSAVGYTRKTMRDVSVSVDLTTRADFSLSQEAVQAEEIVVTAERRVIKKDLTSSESRVTAQQIESLPVSEVAEVLSLQAGITTDKGGGIHIRGGRTSEVAYWVDGVSVSDVYDGTQAVQVDNNSVQELQVISGTFNAEYGQAMSGIVNIVTKDGDQEFRGSLSSYAGDYLTADDGIFFNSDDIRPFASRNVEGSISGPVPGIQGLTFYVSGRYFETDGWLYGNRVYNADGTLASAADTNRDDSGNQLSLVPGSHPVPMNNRTRLSGQAKLTYQFSGDMKLALSGLASDVEFRDYNHDYKYMPDADVRKFDRGYSVSALWTHSLSPTSLYTVNTSYFMKQFDEYLYENPLDPRYIVTPDPVLRQRNLREFLKFGTNNHQFVRRTESRVAKLDYTDQVSRLHQIKAGVEGKLHRLYLEDYNVRNAPNTTTVVVIPEWYGPQYQEYTERPVEFSAYLQDKLEYESMIVNVGLRFDYFDSRGRVPLDPQDPNAFNPAKDENRVDLNGDGIKSDLEQVEPGVLSARLARWYRSATAKYSVSPRLGISYPITDRGVLHFSYGHFLQIPSFIHLYQNPGFKVQPTLAGVQGVYGNADLEAQKTVQYELGLQQQLTEDLSFDLTGFYRDTREWVTTSTAIPVRDPATAISSYTTYENKDYANARGITLSLNKRPSNLWSLSLSYTYQTAEGINSNPDDAQAALVNNSQPAQQLIPLDWDQTHTANLTVGVGEQDWGVFLLARYGSGLPYSPVLNQAEGSGQDANRAALRNSRRRPPSYTVDMRLFKNFRVEPLDVSVFLKVFNLFDRRNENDIYGETGRATATPAALGLPASPGTDRVNTVVEFLNQPQFYSEPREVQIGLEINF